MTATMKPDVTPEGIETAPVTSNTGKSLAQSAQTKQVKINLDDVFISKNENIRDLKSYSEEDMAEMMAQIEGVGGIMQPIGVCRVKPTPDTENKELILIWGFRRSLALLRLAEQDEHWKKDVPARLVEKGNESTGAIRILQLVENKARKDLNAMETAIAINEALNDKDSDLNQTDIARILGMSTPSVSQHMKLLRFPKAVQEAISSGNLPFSHAREILARVPETSWVNVAKKASGMNYSLFMEWLDREHPVDGEAGEGGEVSANGEKSSSQKPAKMLRATDVTGKYVPFLKKQVESADKTNKSFTAADLAQAKLDAVQTILLNPDTQLAKDIDPFLKEMEQKEIEEKQNEEAKKAEAAFFKKQVARVEELYDVEPDPTKPDAERPKLAQVYAQVGREIFALPAEEKAKLGFKLTEDPEALVTTLANVYTETIKERQEAKKKREEAKAKKAAEQKEQTAAAGK